MKSGKKLHQMGLSLFKQLVQLITSVLIEIKSEFNVCPQQ